MASLLSELKRRNVFRVAFAYLILGWLILQITDIVAPALLLPEWTMSLVTFLGMIGFPFALFFTWAFELTPEGLKRSHEVTPGDSITHETGASLNHLIIGLMAAAILALLVDRFFITGNADQQPALSASAKYESSQTSTQTEPIVQMTRATVTDKPRSIAVLPFVNMSNDPEQEFFSDGISEELLNGLARIRELRVAARTSSFAFKGQNQDITKIGEQLKVETVLEGSVRKSGKRIRITAQLINVDDGYHLWSDTYDRDLTDIFVIQDEISAAIVEALKVHLTDGELSASSATPITEQAVQGYEYFLLARHELRKRLQESIELAATLYDKALQASPDYAPAIAGKALAVYFNGDKSYGVVPQQEAAEEAEALAKKALTLDNSLSDAHGILGLIAMDRWNMHGAVGHFDRAIQANPNLAILYNWKANALNRMGRHNEAIELERLALRLDPHHPVISSNWMVELVGEMRYQAALDFYQNMDKRSWVVEAAYATLLRRQGNIAAGYQHLKSQYNQSSAAEQANYRVANYAFNFLKQTNVRDEVLPADRWTFSARMDAPQNIVTMSAMLNRKQQKELGVLVPLAAAYLQLGELEMSQRILDGRTSYQRSLVLSNNEEFSPLRGVTLEIALRQKQGDATGAGALLAELNAFLTQAQADGATFIDVEVAQLYALQGKAQLAISILEQSRNKNSLRWYTQYYPEFDTLRELPAFRAVYAQLHTSISRERGKLGWPALKETSQ